MSNDNAPFGARYIGQLQGMSATGSFNNYTVLAADGTAIFIGDFVTNQGDSALGQDGVPNPTAIQSTAADKITGFVVGFDAERDYESQIYRTGSTLRTMQVCDDPYAIFLIQANGTIASANVGLNADFAVGTGSTITGLSGATLDIATIADTAGLPLRIVGIANQIKNTEIGDYTILKCMMNYTTYKDTTGV